ncbi:probable protein phosphatase 2C T23F11.1 isoform X2 [Halyomorpha halys]|uniref:probable protein phosphatase 2C T23F11.1 isoform X2 n=1 Tax=Halyomorpha halys TaxID=286706 RepID=UPI0006D51C82|nr:probable protein phosphatase 2C T23F11.1 isoform X2 [Halyomorpha halys]
MSSLKFTKIFFDEPITEKETYFGITNDYIVGAGSMQGWRKSMEDAFAIAVTMPTDPQTSFLGVFDGHGGHVIADFLSKNIFNYIITDPAYLNGNVKTGIENAFMRLDSYLMKDILFGKTEAGSTAVVVVIKDDTIYCANVGDSRAIAFANNEVVPLSTDHKPMLPIERQRILEAGCFINFDRVNGDLALSRAFGDFSYKKNKNKSVSEQAVISQPEVVKKTITQEWEFVVLACDGVWDVMTNEQVCRFIRMRIERNIKPDLICEQLLDECLCKENPSARYIGTDNMTVIILVFLKNTRLRRYQGIEPRASSLNLI